MGTYKQKFIGDEADLAKSYDSLLKQQIKMEQQIAASNAKADSANRKLMQQNKGIGGVLNQNVQSLRQTALQYVSIQAAAAGVTQELERQKRLNREAKDLTLSVADAQAKVSKNIGLDVSNQQFQSFITQLNKIQSSSGFQSNALLNVAASNVLSGTGANQKQTLEILQQAAPLFRDAPEDITEFSSLVASIQKFSGGGSAKQATALALTLQSQARIEDLPKLKEFGPVIASGRATQLGVAPELANRNTAALFAAITQEIEDKDGSIAKTATANLLSNIEREIGGKGLTFNQRLQTARQRIQGGDDELLERLISSGFRGPTKPVIREFLRSGDSALGRRFQSTFDTFAVDEQLLDQKRNQLSVGTRQLAVASSARAGQAVNESITLRSSGDIRATVNDIVAPTLERVIDERSGAFTRFAAGVSVLPIAAAARQFSSDPIETGIIQLENLRRNISPNTRVGRESTIGGQEAPIIDDQFRYLIEQNIEELKRMRKAVEKNGGVNPALQNQAQNERS